MRATNSENFHEGELMAKIIAYLSMNHVFVYRHQNSGVLNKNRIVAAMTTLFAYLFTQPFLLSKTRKAISEACAKCYEQPTGTKKGVPDIVGFSKRTGVMIGIEVKIGADKLSKEQIEFRDELVAAGGRFIEARSYEQFLQAYRNYEPPKPKSESVPQNLFYNTPIPQ